MTLPQPIPYQGSKRQLAPAIAAYLPVNTQRLIEPFAGSAALSMYAASIGLIHEFWLNDANKPLMQLWEVMLQQPDRLANQYEKLWHMQENRERTFYDAVRERFNKSHRPAFLLYLLARCVKAAVRYNANGEFNQSPDNRRKGRKPDAMRRDICRASQLLRHAHLTALDYKDVLADATTDDIVYLDPPYQGVCTSRDSRYFQGIDFDEFIAVLLDLNKRFIPYILSYDGKTGNKSYGTPLPSFLNLQRIEIDAGRSSQATLLGQNKNTFESLYLSPALVTRLEQNPPPTTQQTRQLTLLPELI
jgi:DNA adenine methylase